MPMQSVVALLVWPTSNIRASELLLLENGNHGCANVPNEHRYRAADWMAEQLGLFANL